MTRLYLDSNIYRYIKPYHPSFNSQLLGLMNELKDRSLFIFSDAHLDDLRNSSKDLKEQDLLLMGEFARDNFFTRDPIKNQVTCRLLTPVEADGQIDHEAYNRSIDNPFNLDELFKDLDDSPTAKMTKDLIEQLFDQPLSSLGQTFDTSSLNESNRGVFDKMLPGYNPDMSLKDFLKSISPFTSSLMKNASQMTELKKQVEDYTKSDAYSFQVWGMDFNQKVKESFGKSFLDLIDSMLLEKQKGDFYLRFHYAYTILEMFNITQEKVGGKIKKLNFKSLSQDAEHAYFGSMCDCLVTDDKGLQVKAAILYELFGIDTKIMSSGDFVASENYFLTPLETLSDFNQALIDHIENSKVLSYESVIENRELITNYELERPIFNFFTFMQTIRGQATIQVILVFERKWNHMLLLYREIELIVAKCNKIFGIDDDDIGQFNFDEKTDANSPLRSWLNRTFQLFIGRENNCTYVFLSMWFKP